MLIAVLGDPFGVGSEIQIGNNQSVLVTTRRLVVLIRRRYISVHFLREIYFCMLLNFMYSYVFALVMRLVCLCLRHILLLFHCLCRSVFVLQLYLSLVLI